MEKALDWIADALNVDGRKLTLEDTRMSVSEWDSLGAMILLSRLEEDHRIVIEADKLNSMVSVKEICDLLQEHGVFAE